MLINNEFEVAAPIDKVWAFFGDIPQVAACLPGTELTEDLGGDKYKGQVSIRMGPVKLSFGGTAHITERDEAAHRIVVDASGAEAKGRGQASMVVTATLTKAKKGAGEAGGGGTKVAVAQDLQLAGAAAQYGRGMITDVSSVLMSDFSRNLRNRISGDGQAPAAARPAGGLALGLRAALMALGRVYRRFFLPYRATAS
jgi:uncharacterized protein